MMNPDILIVREMDGFRLLHGQLHLANVLSRFAEVTVKVSGEGEAQVLRGSNGFLVEKDGQRLALRRN